MAEKCLPTTQKMQGFSSDGDTFRNYLNGKLTDGPNPNRDGVDVGNLEKLKKLALEQAAGAARLQTYLTVAQMRADTSQPVPTTGQVTNDPDTDSNGYYVWDGSGWLWSGLQPVDIKQVNNAISKKITKAPKSGSITPVAYAKDRVAIWLENGNLGAKGVTPDLKSSIGISELQYSQEGIVPIAYARNKIALWLDKGRLGASGVTDALRNLIIGEDADAPAGASLFRMRAKRGQLIRGVTESKLRVGFAGDSWAEMERIPAAFRAIAEARFGIAGEGWQSVNAGNKLGGVTFSFSAGWTVAAGSDQDGFPFGCGVDGLNKHTTLTTATMRLADCIGTDFKIFYQQTDGAFRYRVDDGDWQTVECTDDGTVGVVVINGLSDIAHSIDIDTSVNTGTVSIHGFYSTRASTSGVEVSKIGRSGLDGLGMLQFVENMGDFVSALNLDLLIVILGTNDYRRPRPSMRGYEQALKEIVDVYRINAPDTGVIFVAPCDTNANPWSEPLIEYVKAMEQVAKENGVEFFNFHSMCGTWQQENVRGQFSDNLHLSHDGAVKLVDELNNKFNII